MLQEVRDRFLILERYKNLEAADARVLDEKLDVLKEIGLMLIEELDSFGSVRTLNLSKGISLPDELRIFETHLIQSALARTGGHQTRAAQMLGISLTTLHNKLKRLNISLEPLADAPVIHEDMEPIVPRPKRETGGIETEVDNSYSAL
jgi:DNA-binding NtrC family response regulator